MKYLRLLTCLLALQLIQCSNDDKKKSPKPKKTEESTPVKKEDSTSDATKKPAEPKVETKVEPKKTSFSKEECLEVSGVNLGGFSDDYMYFSKDCQTLFVEDASLTGSIINLSFGSLGFNPGCLGLFSSDLTVRFSPSSAEIVTELRRINPEGDLDIQEASTFQKGVVTYLSLSGEDEIMVTGGPVTVEGNLPENYRAVTLTDGITANIDFGKSSTCHYLDQLQAFNRTGDVRAEDVIVNYIKDKFDFNFSPVVSN